MNILRFKKISILKLISVPIFFFIYGFRSDYLNYYSYYINCYLNNFYNYAFEPGFSFLMAVANELNIPFEIFWIVCNGFSIITMFAFITPKATSKSFSAYVFFAFLLTNILSANLFSNLIRNTIGIGITLLLINKKAKWYFFLIPPFFHLASIFLIFSHWITNFFSRIKVNYVVLITILAYLLGPVIGIIGKDIIIDFLSSLDIRGIVNNLTTEYKPSYRYLSVILYLSLSYFLYVCYLSYKKNKFKNFGDIYTYGISIKNLFTLCVWTIISYPLYLATWGYGQFGRFLTFQIWVGEFMILYFFIININNYFKNFQK